MGPLRHGDVPRKSLAFSRAFRCYQPAGCDRCHRRLRRHSGCRNSAGGSPVACVPRRTQRAAAAISAAAALRHGQLAVKLHDKLVRDHQTLLAEAARSRAMKQLRSQLAKKQSVVAAERQKLQSDAMQLAEVEQHARSLLSPKYTPSAQELQAVSQEVNVAPPPPLSLVQPRK